MIISHNQSSKVSRSPINRLAGKDRSCPGQKNPADHKPDKPLASSSDAAAASSAHGPTLNTKLSGPNLRRRRQTLLFEDRLDSASHNYRDSVRLQFGSQPNCSMDAPVFGSRTVILHHTASTELPPPPSSSPSAQGLSHDFLKLICSG